MPRHHYSEHSIPVEEPERSEALARLKAAISGVPSHEFAEVWVNHGDFPAISALVNGNRGWLMLIRYDGDAGYSSRSSDYTGDPLASLEFFLSNGQRDLYPAAWTLPTQEVFEALEHFAATSSVPESIKWVNDSGDSTQGPNDPHFTVSK